MESKTAISNSPVIYLDSLEYFSPFEGLKSKLIHTETQTFSFWEIEKDAELPRHQHVNEQVSIVTKGTLELTIGDETFQMTSGMVAVIPPNTDHQAKAITDVEVTDVFYPIREDFPK